MTTYYPPYFYKAKPIIELEEDGTIYWETKENLDYLEKSGYYKEGYVYGYITGNVIVGPVLEMCNDYIIHEYWIKIDPNTIELLKPPR